MSVTRKGIMWRRFECAQAHNAEKNARDLKWMRETEKPMLQALERMLKAKQGQ